MNCLGYKRMNGPKTSTVVAWGPLEFQSHSLEVRP